MKELITDMAYKMYSDEYVKRYRPFLPFLTIVQKPKDVQRFLVLAKACLTCNAYEELHKIKCPVFVIGGREDKVVSGMASKEIVEKLNCKLYMYDALGHAAYEEAKDFNQRVYEFFEADMQIVTIKKESNCLVSQVRTVTFLYFTIVSANIL